MTTQALFEIVERLVRLARQILGTDADYILVLEEYSQVLNENEAQIVAAVDNSEIRPKLQELSGLHQKLMDKVAKEQTQLRAQISDLKKKGKAVITYTDYLPKSISLGTKRKV